MGFGVEERAGPMPVRLGWSLGTIVEESSGEWFRPGEGGGVVTGVNWSVFAGFLPAAGCILLANCRSNDSLDL